MLAYFKVVQGRLFRAYWIITVVLCLALLIMLVILAVSQNNFKEFLSPEAVAYSVILSASLSIFILILAFFSEYNEFQLQQALFSKIPIATIGFVKVQLMKNSLWKLYREAYAASKGGFHVIADFYTKSKISFSILSERDLNIPIQTPDKYREIEIFPESTGMTMIIPVDSFGTPSENTINELLIALTSTMKKQGYEPAIDFKLYEKKLKKDILAKSLKGGIG